MECESHHLTLPYTFFQFFSRIALWLRRKNVWMVPELHEAMKQAYTPRPETHNVELNYDISGWLSPHIIKIKNHVYPHTFKFFLGEDNKSKMVYKSWAQDKTWLPEGEPLTILESLPQGVPNVLRPGLGGKVTMKVNEIIAKVKASCHRMSQEHLAWWKTFIVQEKSTRKKWEDMTVEENRNIAEENWPLKKLKEYAEAQQLPSVAETEEARLDTELDRLLAKQNNFPLVGTCNYIFKIGGFVKQ